MKQIEFLEYLSQLEAFTVVGASLSVTLPLGQYFDDKILNIGQNHFGFHPQIGFVYHVGTKLKMTDVKY